MAENEETTEKKGLETQTESTVIKKPDIVIFEKILEVYPFLNEQEKVNYIEKTSHVGDINPLKNIQNYLQLLNNPHAEVKELRLKGRSEFPSPIKRPDNIDLESPFGVVLGDFLYIDVPSWHNRLTETTSILDKLVDEHSTAKGFIVDLRKNSGGGDSPARKFAQHFLPTGEIVFGKHVIKKEGRTVEEPLVFHSHNDRPINTPIVLLVSGTTFSACERFIALIKQRGNVTIIGSETRGGSAGAVDHLIEIDGISYTILIPTWRLFLPDKDKPLEETKIQPDFYYDPTKPEIVEFAVKYLKK